MFSHTQENTWYAFAQAQEVALSLPPEEMARIQKYTRKEVELLPSRGTSPNDPEYWNVRLDAAFVLHIHHNPIQRHEGAFALGAFTYGDELERDAAVKNLRYSMRYDESIVVRHEAIEALGSPYTFCTRSISAAADMCKINLLWPDYSDVVATAKESFTNILAWLKNDKRHVAIVRELETWWALPRLTIPKSILTGSREEAWLMYMQYRKQKEKK